MFHVRLNTTGFSNLSNTTIITNDAYQVPSLQCLLFEKTKRLTNIASFKVQWFLNYNPESHPFCSSCCTFSTIEILPLSYCMFLDWKTGLNSKNVERRGGKTSQSQMRLPNDCLWPPQFWRILNCRVKGKRNNETIESNHSLHGEREGTEGTSLVFKTGWIIQCFTVNNINIYPRLDHRIGFDPFSHPSPSFAPLSARFSLVPLVSNDQDGKRNRLTRRFVLWASTVLLQLLHRNDFRRCSSQEKKEERKEMEWRWMSILLLMASRQEI